MLSCNGRFIKWAGAVDKVRAFLADTKSKWGGRARIYISGSQEVLCKIPKPIKKLFKEKML